MGRRRFLLALFLGLNVTAALLPPASASASPRADPLFILARRKNANEVHYDASVSASGASSMSSRVVRRASAAMRSSADAALCSIRDQF